MPVLAEFASRRGITFPLLSDTGSAVIRQYGLLNTTVATTNTTYGIPFPGTFIVDGKGVVTSRYFERAYQERDTITSVLVKLGAKMDLPATKAFYSSVFGWKFEDYGPEYASFHDGRIAGGFRKEKKIRSTGPLIVLYSSDLDAIQRRIILADGKITKPTFEFPGGRRFHFSDPNGNELAVWSNV